MTRNNNPDDATPKPNPADLLREAAAEIAGLKAERRPKLYCAMLTTGVCDQIARAEAAESRLASAMEALTKARDRIAAEHGEYDPQDVRCPVCRHIAQIDTTLSNLKGSAE